MQKIWFVGTVSVYDFVDVKRLVDRSLCQIEMVAERLCHLTLTGSRSVKRL